MSEKTLLSQSVKDAIQEMIFDKLKAGDRLPTEAELTSMFNVSRTSVREALKTLEAARIVEKRNGGTYVVEQIQECFVDPLYVMTRLNVTKGEDLLYVRQILEGEAAVLAAKKAGENIIRELKDTVWMMQKPSITLDEYIELDARFHLLVAEGAQNSVMLQLIKDISTVLVKLYPKCCTLEFVQREAIPLQIQVVAAIENGNSEAAKKALVQHLIGSDEMLKSMME